jgi:hypothetical protein
MRQSIPIEALSGWKDIARYLGKGVRTVQRYEREFGLPVRRLAGTRRSSVIATKAELDGWIAASPIREAFQLPQTVLDNETPLREFRQHVKEMHRLREEAAELRVAIRASLDLLRDNLRSALPERETQEGSARHRRAADGLVFPSKNAVH